MLSNKNILIIGGSPVSLELARSFKRNNAKVFIADVYHTPVSRWSNCVDKYVRIPPPVQALEGFKNHLQRIIQEENITDCIPTYEDSFHVSKIKDALNCKVWVSDLALLNRLHRKDNFIKLAADYFDVPKTVNLNEWEDLSQSQNFVFKSIYSRFANQIYIKPTQKEFQQIDTKSDWIAQEFINGKEFCAYSIWDNGNCKALAIYHPLIRVGVGAGIYYQPIRIAELENRIRKFGTSLDFHGQLSFDFIQRLDKYYVIECNPRATSGVHLLNHRLANAFFEQNTFIQDDGIPKTIKLPLALIKPKYLLDKRFYQAKDAIYEFKDLKPFVLQGLSIIEFFFLALRKGVTFQQATTYFIEWNGQLD